MARLPLPPSPRGTLIGGNHAEMSRDWLAAYARYARDHGDVVAYRLGPMRLALVSHPALIEQLLRSRAHLLRKSPIQNMLRPLVGNGIFLSEGDYWKRQRRLVSPPFHRKRIAVYADAMVRIARKMATEVGEDETRDMYKDMTRLTLRVVSATLFDAELDSDALGIEAKLTEAVQAFSARLDSALPLPNWMPTREVRRIRAARRDVDRLVDGFIAQRRDKPSTSRTPL
jgi:cytochrome P450